MMKVILSVANYPIAYQKLKGNKKINEIVYTDNSVKSYQAINKKCKRKEEINDYLRFTIEVPNIQEYDIVCNHYKNKLNTFKVTNHWKIRNKAYNGYHVYAKTTAKFPYEVQIHTSKSLQYRDNKMSHTLYESSKYALDNNNQLLYRICQLLIFGISSELILESLYVNFFLHLDDSFL